MWLLWCHIPSLLYSCFLVLCSCNETIKYGFMGSLTEAATFEQGETENSRLLHLHTHTKCEPDPSLSPLGKNPILSAVAWGGGLLSHRSAFLLPNRSVGRSCPLLYWLKKILNLSGPMEWMRERKEIKTQIGARGKEKEGKDWLKRGIRPFRPKVIISTVVPSQMNFV